MSEFLDKFWVGLACAFVGAALNEIVHRIRARTALVTAVADRYIAEARTGNDTPAFRLMVMQRAGIALLSHRQLKAFINEVTGRGCTHPFKDSQIEDDIPSKELPAFVRACSERGYILDSDQSIPIAIANLTHEAQKKKTEKARK